MIYILDSMILSLWIKGKLQRWWKDVFKIETPVTKLEDLQRKTSVLDSSNLHGAWSKLIQYGVGHGFKNAGVSKGASTNGDSITTKQHNVDFHRIAVASNDQKWPEMQVFPRAGTSKCLVNPGKPWKTYEEIAFSLHSWSTCIFRCSKCRRSPVWLSSRLSFLTPSYAPSELHVITLTYVELLVQYRNSM